MDPRSLSQSPSYDVASTIAAGPCREDFKYLPWSKESAAGCTKAGPYRVQCARFHLTESALLDAAQILNSVGFESRTFSCLSLKLSIGGTGPSHHLEPEGLCTQGS